MSLPATTEWDAVDQARVDTLSVNDPLAWDAQLAAASVATVQRQTPRPGRPRFVHSVISMTMAVGGLMTLAMRVRRRTR